MILRTSLVDLSRLKWYIRRVEHSPWRGATQDCPRPTSSHVFFTGKAGNPPRMTALSRSSDQLPQMCANPQPVLQHNTFLRLDPRTLESLAPLERMFHVEHTLQMPNKC